MEPSAGSPLSDKYIYTNLDDEVNDNSSQRDLQKVLRTIETAAYAAGEITLQTAGKIAVKTTKMNTQDLVTESDVACQELIKEIIQKDYPNDLFLGEEDVDLNEGGSAKALRTALGCADNEKDDCLLFVVVST